VLSQYGPTIYRHFFLDYTRKFLGLHPSEVDPEWGRLSVERSVIDRRIKASSIIDLFNSLLLAKPVQLDFLYPERGGTQAFPDALALQVSCNAGSVLTGRTVKRIVTGRGRIKGIVTTRGDRIETDELVWSAPITELMTLLKMGTGGLRFLDTILYNVETDVLPVRQYQWCYFGEKETSFVRYSVPSYFSPRNATGERYGVCVEITSYRDGALWKKPEERTAAVIRDLVRNGVIPHENNIRTVRIERIENTYPVYSLGYRPVLDSAMAELSQYRNLRLLGRCGRFWYNNLDHSIRQAMDLADAMASGQRKKKQ
jgi:protoporphyrinogen oxidase